MINRVAPGIDTPHARGELAAVINELVDAVNAITAAQADRRAAHTIADDGTVVPVAGKYPPPDDPDDPATSGRALFAQVDAIQTRERLVQLHRIEAILETLIPAEIVDEDPVHAMELVAEQVRQQRGTIAELTVAPPSDSPEAT